MFLAGASKNEVVEYVASERFKDDNGNPYAWKLQAISSEQDERLRKDCTKKVPVGRRGQYTQDVDTDKYIAKVCVASTVEPNLNSAEFQDAFGVHSGEELLRKLLKPGEYTDFKAKVMEVNGYDLSMDELVDEAKN